MNPQISIKQEKSLKYYRGYSYLGNAKTTIKTEKGNIINYQTDYNIQKRIVRLSETPKL